MRIKVGFKYADAAWILRLMLLFLVSTLLQGLISFSLNRIIAVAILFVILYHDLYCFTLKRLCLFFCMLVGISFTCLISVELALNIKDWIYVVTTLLFVDFISDDYGRIVFDSAIDNCKKLIDVISLFCIGVTLISMIVPSGYSYGWGNRNYVGFTGGEHIAANGLCLLAVFRLLVFRRKPLLLIDMLQLLFILAAVFMTGARTYIIPAAIIVYSYIKQRVHNPSIKILIYGFVLLVAIAVFVKSNMLQKFLWTADASNTNASNALSAFTSGRSEFWVVDIQEFARVNWIRKLLGSGFDHVYYVNLQYCNMKIWAHNDLIHLLLGSGLLGLGIYVWTWARFWKQHKKQITSQILRLCLFVYIVFPMMFNGVMISQHYLMSIIIFAFCLTCGNETGRIKE